MRSILVVLSVCLITVCAHADNHPVQLFVLAGQSNMVGHGKVEDGLNPDYDFATKTGRREIPGGIGGLRHLATNPATAAKYEHLLDGKDWRVRDDVWIYSTTGSGGAGEKGKLTVGFGKGRWFGPELAFGYAVGDHVEAPVVLVKTAWGGHSLGVKFRSPSAGQPAYKHKPEDVGNSYREMIRIVTDVRDNLGNHFPELAGRKVEIAGFGWHQGWNDGVAEMTAEYDSNMTHFINDVRRDLGVKNLPFAIANTGMIGTGTTGTRNDLAEIQLAMADPKKHPEFKGTVAAVDTRPFKRTNEQSPSGFGYHWNHNAESHFLVGDALGRAMVGLLKK